MDSNHLELSKFCQNLRTYFNVRFRGTVPENNICMYISPFISPTWWASLKNRKVKEKNLGAIIAVILEESCVRNPVHNRRMDLLRVRRAGFIS